MVNDEIEMTLYHTAMIWGRMVFSFQARKKATKELAIEEARIDQQRIAYLARSCMTAEWE